MQHTPSHRTDILLISSRLDSSKVNIIKLNRMNNIVESTVRQTNTRNVRFWFIDACPTPLWVILAFAYFCYRSFTRMELIWKREPNNMQTLSLDTAYERDIYNFNLSNIVRFICLFANLDPLEIAKMVDVQFTTPNRIQNWAVRTFKLAAKVHFWVDFHIWELQIKVGLWAMWSVRFEHVKFFESGSKGIALDHQSWISSRRQLSLVCAAPTANWCIGTVTAPSPKTPQAFWAI